MRNSNGRRVLGIDCGTAITGWAVIEAKGTELKHIAAGAIITPSKIDITQRLKIIFDGLQQLIETYEPDEFAVEALYFFKNQRTVMQVSQARGVVLLSAAVKNLPAVSYTPLQVKSAVTGYGRADKKQVQFMVKQILKLKNTPKPDDVADAIAVAICHINSTK